MSTLLERPDQRQQDSVGPRPSTWVFRGVVVLLFLLLLAQAWRLQIVDGRAYVGRSAANFLRSAIIPPQRGVIYDRNQTLLASNAPIFVVSVTPADVPQDRMEEVLIRIANELRVALQELEPIVTRRQDRSDYNPYNAIPVRYGVDRDAVMRLAERSAEIPGMQIGVDTMRRYTEGALISHLIGYMGPLPADDSSRLEEQGYSPDDRMGAAGVEQWYEKDLRGRPGRRLYQVEATGQEVGELRREAAQPGNSLVVSIDLDLQRDVMRILEEGLPRSHVGAAIVSDPRTGELLAMVSTPTFDNNIIEESAFYTDAQRQEELQALLSDEVMQPMFQRAFAGNYAPGSVFKLVTGAAALQEKVATRDTIIDSKGVMFVERDEFPEIRDRFVDNAAWGPQNFLQGLSNSSNIYFFWLGGGFEEGGQTIFKGLGVENLARFARSFGFGDLTGLDVQGEKRGIIPDPLWKQIRKGEPWYRGDTYNMSIGQGDVLVTPLQVANATNAIANGGTLFQPQLAKFELNPDGDVVRVFEPEARKVDVEPQHLALMREAMEFAFDGPHLRAFKIEGLRAGGKTGTAEFYGPLDEKGNLPSHGWFTGFAPADDPVVAVTVFVENGSGSGSEEVDGAAPIGARILRRYFGIPDEVPPTPEPTATPAPVAP